MRVPLTRADDLTRRRGLRLPALGFSEDPAETAALQMHGWEIRRFRHYTKPDIAVRDEEWGREHHCSIVRAPDATIYISFRYHKIVTLPIAKPGLESA